MTTHTREVLFSDSLGELAAGLGRILFIRHGKGRGPEIRLRDFRPEYFDPLLADFARRYPEMRKRIAVWETGTPQPYLYDVKVVVFLLQDPLRESFPECYAEAAEIAEASRRLGIRMINAPAAMSNTIKSVQSRLWLEAGLPTPVHHPFRSMIELRDVSELVKFPAVLQADSLHEHSGTRVVETREQLLRIDPLAIVFPGSLSEFVDIREGYRRTAPESEYAKFFHMKQALVFGDHLRFGHLLFSPDPVVKLASSTLSYSGSLNPIKRASGKLKFGDHTRIDNEFRFREGDPNPDLFVRAAKALNLEWVAIDYSTCADGGVILWDAKAHFPLHLPPVEMLRRRRMTKHHNRLTHDVVLQYLERLFAA